jgi:hypothetical protein
MWPEPNPPIGDAPGELELAAFVRSAILAGVGATALHRQVCARFRPRPGAKQWHRTSIQRVVKRERRALQLRAWLETEQGRSELAAEAARLVQTASLTFGVVGLSSAASRLALAETFTRAAQGAASPAELDQLAATLARLERRPGRKGGHS